MIIYAVIAIALAVVLAVLGALVWRGGIGLLPKPLRIDIDAPTLYCREVAQQLIAAGVTMLLSGVCALIPRTSILLALAVAAVGIFQISLRLSEILKRYRK